MDRILLILFGVLIGIAISEKHITSSCIEHSKFTVSGYFGGTWVYTCKEEIYKGKAQ